MRSSAPANVSTREIVNPHLQIKSPLGIIFYFDLRFLSAAHGSRKILLTRPFTLGLLRDHFTVRPCLSVHLSFSQTSTRVAM